MPQKAELLQVKAIVRATGADKIVPKMIRQQLVLAREALLKNGLITPCSKQIRELIASLITRKF